MKDILIFLDTDVLACGDISPGFQSRIGSLACMLPRLHVMDSSDSPLVQYLLTCTMKNFNLCAFIVASRCAFSAQGWTHHAFRTNDSPIPFPNVDLNTCGGYDAKTGKQRHVFQR